MAAAAAKDLNNPNCQANVSLQVWHYVFCCKSMDGLLTIPTYVLKKNLKRGEPSWQEEYSKHGHRVRKPGREGTKSTARHSLRYTGQKVFVSECGPSCKRTTRTLRRDKNAYFIKDFGA